MSTVTRHALDQELAQAREQRSYHIYLEVRDRVLTLVEEDASRPSGYWREELDGFDYMLDASPLIIRKLRQHCYHLTGLRAYDYRGHHAHRQPAFAAKLAALRALDRAHLFVPESAELGGFGHCIDGSLVNVDTLKCYEALIALDRAGVLEPWRATEGRGITVLEIGAGWGGFAYQMKTLFPGLRYVIVDLPQSLVFSAVYLRTLFPAARTWMLGDESPAPWDERRPVHDFVFLTPDALSRWPSSAVDLAVNMVSFQEMTSEQVEAYVGSLARLRCPRLYSLNRDRSAHNAELSEVSRILERRYALTEIEMLGVPYTSLRTQPSRAWREQLSRWKPRWLRRPVVRSVEAYRHLLGARREVCAS